MDCVLKASFCHLPSVCPSAVRCPLCAPRLFAALCVPLSCSLPSVCPSAVRCPLYAPRLFAALCVPLGCCCSHEVGFVLGMWLPSPVKYNFGCHGNTIGSFLLLQLYYQALNFVAIVSSALMIWKGLMVVTGSESPIVVVLR